MLEKQDEETQRNQGELEKMYSERIISLEDRLLAEEAKRRVSYLCTMVDQRRLTHFAGTERHARKTCRSDANEAGGAKRS